ncbi:MAG: choline transporter [Deltaproteobacteria bacterium]|nr:choline transporter [Deltaproteobacteria bacterium]
MKSVDWPVFLLAFGGLILVTLPLVVSPESSKEAIDFIYAGLTLYLGPVYLWAGAGSLMFVGYLAFGPYASIVLGPPGESREFSDASWFSMLFCAGIASGLLYWGGIEWAYYYSAPPWGAEVGSPEAILWATSYPLFHWGFTAWAFYALPTVAVAYACHRGGETSYRLSRACRPLLGDRVEGAWGRAIDILFIVGILGGASTSLGLSTPMIAEGIGVLTGLNPSFEMQIWIVLLCSVIFATSVYVGLERGIRVLSNANLWMALGLIAFILIVGDTGFILKMGTASIGHVLQNFIAMNLWTDPVLDTGFVESWTIFYWAWWIAFAPFVGLFVARISRGRTIRQVILGTLFLGTAGAWIFFIVLGNYALSLELTGSLPVLQILEDRGGPATIIAVIASLPWPMVSLSVFCLVAILYLATTFDSAAYTIASGASRELGSGGDPDPLHRGFWAVAVAVLPLSLMGIGGLQSLRTASLVASLPLLGVGCLLAMSLIRALRNEVSRTS